MSSYFDPPSSGRLVPLTTAFVKPSSCSNFPYIGLKYTTEDPYTIIYRSVPDDCVPSKFQEVYDTYSPGMCPSGYTTLSSAVSNGLTSAHCCPEGDGWVAYGYFCAKGFNTPQVVERWYTDSSSYTTTTLTSYTIESEGIHVFYRQSDLSLFPAGYTPGVAFPAITGSSSDINTGSSTKSSPTTATSPGTSPSLTTTSPPGPTSTDNSSPLSAGAKAGIGVGIALGVAVLALGVFFVLWHRKRALKKKGETPHPDGPELDGDDIKEISGEDKKPMEPKSAELAAADESHPDRSELKGEDSHPNHAELKDEDIKELGSPLEKERAELTAVAPSQNYGDQVSSNFGTGPVELTTEKEHQSIVELDGNRNPTTIHELPSTSQHASSQSSVVSTPPFKAPNVFNSSQAGPIQEYLYEESSAADGNYSKQEVAQPADSTPDPVPSPLSQQALEIQWLEREEARIRERKAQLLQESQK